MYNFTSVEAGSSGYEYDPRSSIVSALRDLANSVNINSCPIIIGSLGRRLSLANSSSPVSSAQELIDQLEGPLFPRLGDNSIFDIDFIVDERACSWGTVSGTCNSIFKSNGRVELDPHLGTFKQSYLLHADVSNKYFPITYMSGEVIPVTGLDKDSTIFLPDLPTQLAYMFNFKEVRPKDVFERDYFFKQMLLNPELSENPNFFLALELHKIYRRTCNPKDSLRRVYHLLPPKVRKNIGLRRRIQTLRESEYVRAGYLSSTPIYV